MKKFLKALYEAHNSIGNILTSVCIGVAILAIIGLLFGITRCSGTNQIVETNFFLNEDVTLHNGNYFVNVSHAWTSDSIEVKNKNGESVVENGNFICVEFSINQNSGSNLKKHDFDTNDFKLKNHTGAYLPLNDIAGAIGWDAIDVHYDTEGGGFVMSSVDFSTKKALDDYYLLTQHIEPTQTLDMVIYFQMDEGFRVETELMVLEFDFYFGQSGYRQGSDIVLLPRPVSSNSSSL